MLLAGNVRHLGKRSSCRVRSHWYLMINLLTYLPIWTDVPIACNWALAERRDATHQLLEALRTTTPAWTAHFSTRKRLSYYRRQKNEKDGKKNMSDIPG